VSRRAAPARRPLAGYVPAMSNPYGISLDREWTEWAAKARVSPTVTAALLLISRSRPLPEIVARLTPGELEQIVGVIGRWPDCFPHGTLAALRSLRATMSRPNHQPASRRPGRINAKGLHTRALTRKLEHPLGAPTERGYARHAHHAKNPGTRPGTRAETARRRMVVEDLMKAGLSVRAISAGTGIPRSSVHRAMAAIVRAQAKQEVAIAEVAKELLGKGLSPRRRG